MRKELKLYLSFIRVYFKSIAQYKLALFIETISNIITICSSYVFLTVLFTKINSISGWNYYEVVYLVSLNWICTAFSGFFFWKPMVTQGEMIRDGSFDTMLTRPIHPLKFCIYRQFQHTFLGRLLLATFFLVYSMRHLNLQMNLTFFLSMILVLFCGTLIHSGVWIIVGATSFWMTNNSNLVSVFNSYDGIRSIIDYPLSIFPGIVQIIYTFIIPYGFINYYPSVSLFHKEDMFSNLPMAIIGPIMSIAFFAFAVFIWNQGVKRYHSAGA